MFKILTLTFQIRNNFDFNKKNMKYSKLFQIFCALSIFLSVFSIQAELAKTSNPTYVIPCQIKQQNTNQNQPTVIKFYVQLKVKQQQDYIQMSLTVKEKDTSLKKAIDKVTRKVQSVKAACINYCKKNNGQNCQQKVQVDNFKVQPAYQIVRRQPIFNDFIVTHQITVVVYETKDIGELVDSILGLGVYEIDELQWKPNVEVDLTQKAIDAGLTKGKQLCKHINRQIGTILSIQQRIFEDEQQEKDQEQTTQQDQQNEQDIELLQFKIQCVDKPEEKVESKQNKNKVQTNKADKTKKKK